MALPANARNILVKFQNYEAQDPMRIEGVDLTLLRQIDLDRLENHDPTKLLAASSTLFKIARATGAAFSLTYEEQVQTEMLATYLLQTALPRCMSSLYESIQRLLSQILSDAAFSMGYAMGCHHFWPGWDLRDQSIGKVLYSSLYMYPYVTYRIIHGCVKLALGRITFHCACIIVIENAVTVSIHLAAVLSLRVFLSCIAFLWRVFSQNAVMCITVLVIVRGFSLASNPRAMLGQLSNAIIGALYIANDIFMLLSRLGLLVGFDNLSSLLLFATSLPLNTVLKLRYGTELVWKALRASRFFVSALLTIWNLLTITRRITIPFVAAQLKSSWMMTSSIRVLKRAVRALRGEPDITSLKEFSYDSVAAFDSRRDIRLLQLGKNASLSTLHLRMDAYHLSQAPPYEAISYVWDSHDSTEMETIFLNDQTLKVPMNVYNILYQRSKISNTRRIWIDMICINQKDLIEKTYQVRMMTTIYQKAIEVVVYLGESPNAWLAKSFLEDIMKAKANKTTETFNIYVLSFMFRSRYDQYLRARIDAFIELLRNKWFGRVWIIQEVAFARSIKVVYGGVDISWTSLVNLSSVLLLTMLNASLMLSQVQDQPPYIGDQFMTGAQYLCSIDLQRSSLVRNGSTPLLETLALLNHREATKSIDKIFALLGMTDNAEELRDMIDYRRSVSEILVDLSIHFRQSGQLLQTLYFAGVGWRDQREEVPSWVVDWTMDIFPYSLSTTPFFQSHYRASTDKQFAMREGRSSKEIILSGQLICRIKALGPTCPNSLSIGNQSIYDAGKTAHDMLRQWVEDIYVVVRQNTCYPSDTYHGELSATEIHEAKYLYQPAQSLREAMIHTLLANCEDNLRPAPHEIISDFETYLGQGPSTELICDCLRLLDPKCERREERWENVQGRIQEFMNEDKDKTGALNWSVGDWPVEFARVIKRSPAMGQMQFCVLDDGHFGLVPPGARPGDWMTVIFGAETPFVLRELTDGSEMGTTSEYQIVGHAYVHGMMHGEALMLGKDEVEFVIL